VERYQTGDHRLRVLLDSLGSLSVFPCSAVQSFDPSQRLLSERELLLLVLGFKLLSAGAGSKHGDLCNEQKRDSNERSNLYFGALCPQPGPRRAPLLAKKFICKLAVQIQGDLLEFSHLL